MASIFTQTEVVQFGIDIINNFEITGEEEFNGVNAWRIEGTLDSGAVTILEEATPGYKVHITMWIATDTYLPIGFRTEGRVNGDEPENIIRVVTYSEYDQIDPIEPPQ